MSAIAADGPKPGCDQLELLVLEMPGTKNRFTRTEQTLLVMTRFRLLAQSIFILKSGNLKGSTPLAACVGPLLRFFREVRSLRQVSEAMQQQQGMCSG